MSCPEVEHLALDLPVFCFEDLEKSHGGSFTLSSLEPFTVPRV